MFERYTEKARRVVFFGRYEASQFGEPYIEPEHLLLGFLREDKSNWKRITRDCAEEVSTAFRRAVEVETSHQKKVSTTVDLPLSRIAKQAVAAAAEEADHAAKQAIDTKDLLLGVLRFPGDSVAFEVLRHYEISYRRARAILVDPGDYLRSALHNGDTELYLSDMRLKSVPEEIQQFRNLRELNLSHNQLEELPDFVHALKSLEVLDLSFNNFRRLPLAIAGLTSLRNLDIRQNPNLDIPPELLDAEAQTIISYYFRSAEGGGPLNEAKLILVGRGGVGKTSLVERLVRDQFNQLEPETHGIKITNWRARIARDDYARLYLWDFGGQEIMHATHQFFLTERSLYVVVLSGREGGADADAEYWLKLIASFGGDSPVIVVLNKTVQNDFDVNRRVLERKYGVKAFVKTDCSVGLGLPELRRVIERETSGLEHLRDPFPGSWFKIKNHLSSTKKNFLSFEEYQKVCANFGERDLASQDNLAFCLHNLGIALNYRDDPRLHDTHVLNPFWVTNGIYAILNAPHLRECKGEINLGDLGRILDEAEYPSSMRRFLFDLMKKFELCFSFPDDDLHYLVPELLDIQEPQEAGAVVPDECLNFQYHYEVLPHGLLPRFIVRTHVLSEGLARWRTGVFLNLEHNRAFVKADLEERKVYIHISGATGGRRRLLAVIRSDFEHIHRTIRNLRPTEMVPIPGQPSVVIPYGDLLLWEAEGRQTYPVRVSNTILDLSVPSLLEGIEALSARTARSGNRNQFLPKVFCSYSHKDEFIRGELETHLKVLQRENLIESWHDRNIDAGQDWKKRINENLEAADIILLLISADFVASDYCYELEMKRAMDRHERGDACVIPIIVRDVSWKTAPFASLQVLPKDGVPVTSWPNRDSAWRNVSEGVERVIEALRKSSATHSAESASVTARQLHDRKADLRGLP